MSESSSPADQPEPLGHRNQGDQPGQAKRPEVVQKAEKQKKQKKQQPWYIEIPIVVVCTFVVIFLVQSLIGRVYVIPSASMEPTLHGCAGCTGDRIAVEKVSYYFSDPKPGDVIVFKGTPSWDEGFVSARSHNPVVRQLQNLLSYGGLVAPDENDLVKRVIATGGQTVSCLPGDPGIMVDGAQISDSYTLQPPQYPVTTPAGSPQCGGPYFGPITVPENHLFMMGDNRTNSLDSRFHGNDATFGTIPVENVRGKVQAKIWPPARIGAVSAEDVQAAHS